MQKIKVVLRKFKSSKVLYKISYLSPVDVWCITWMRKSLDFHEELTKLLYPIPWCIAH